MVAPVKVMFLNSEKSTKACGVRCSILTKMYRPTSAIAPRARVIQLPQPIFEPKIRTTISASMETMKTSTPGRSNL